MDDLCNTASVLNVDIIACTETWFHKDILDGYINVPNYDLFRCDRRDRRGGGVCVYVKKSFQVNACNLCVNSSYFHDGVESIWITIKKCKLVFGCVYLPPSCSKDVITTDSLIGCADSLLQNYVVYNLVLCGDFNQADVGNICDNLDLHSSCTLPTRGNVTLDNILVSNNLARYISNICTLPPLCNHLKDTDSDHLIVYLETNNSNPTSDTKVVKCYDFRENSVMASIDYLNNVNFYSLYNAETVDEMVAILYYHLNVAIEMIPFSVVTFTRRDKPWITTLVKNLINKRWKAWREGKMALFNYYKSKVKNEIINAKNNWANKCLETDRGAWNVVDELNNKNNAEDSIIRLLSSRSMTDLLEDFSCKFESTLNHHIQDPIWLPPDDGEIFVDFNCLDVYNRLKKLKRGKSTGNDGISNRLLQLFAAEIAGPLCSIMYNSIRTRTYPTAWKCIPASPVPKVSRPTIDQFRPVCILPGMANIFDRLVHDSIKTDLYEGYYTYQHAFRVNASTETALIQCHSHVCSMLDLNDTKAVRIVFFDLSNAFQKVRHDILIKRLISSNLKPGVIHWIKNYLCNRSMQVRIKGSNGRKISCAFSGVPQGSTLGPALFAVYMSGLGTIIMDENYIAILYADDILLIERVTNNLENHVSKVELILDWCKSLDLPVNCKKLKQMFIPRARGFITPGVTFENIDVVESHKYLGILFNSKFDLSNHIRSALNRASQRIYVIRIVRSILSKKKVKELCNSLVLSRAFYAAPLLYSANKTDQMLLERFVRRCHRVVCNSDCMQNCFETAERTIFKRSQTFFTKCCATNHILNYLVPFYKKRCDIFLLPYCRTTRRKNSFFIKFPTEINKLKLD
jgi:hypothetical protein